ncbi:hypothetical protein EPR50_G00041330 [Perca flavescens]|uniref:Uncharacterized protein n=1 Tax=Perca flavescens TaxID=8167 RepID=A0A484DG94_PERFV|nr:hypothetical protein EPR50_G00041330 [Perca flavescens]
MSLRKRDMYTKDKTKAEPKADGRQSYLWKYKLHADNVMLFSTGILYTGADPQQPSSLRDQNRVNSDSQSKTQGCYANLTLKAPRPQSGRSSPQIQYSDVVHLEEQPESEKEDEGDTDAVSTLSDLYASVQNQRTKTVDNADSAEGYANHL